MKTTPAIHLCFGNYGGQSVQKGTWDKLIGFLNALEVDHIVMEMAHRPAEEVAPSRACGRRSASVSASSTSSAPRSRAPMTIARSIERAASIVGEGRIRWIHPDCGFWMLKRSIADAKIRALVAGRDLFEARDGASAAG